MHTAPASATEREYSGDGWGVIVDTIGDAANPYMHRWVLTTPWGTVRLHHIVRSDDDRCLHDHPWSFVSLILRGGYFDITADAERWCRAGTIVRHRAEDAHRLVVLPRSVGTTWTLVFTGPRRRKWGFHTPDGWVYWREFLADGAR